MRDGRGREVMWKHGKKLGEKSAVCVCVFVRARVSVAVYLSGCLSVSPLFSAPQLVRVTACE